MRGSGRGFVLAVVLFAIVLLAALAAGGFFAGLQEVRAGANAQGAVRSHGAAEAAVFSALAQWDPRLLDSLAIGATAALSPPPPAGMTVSASVRRLGDELFLVRGDAIAPGGASSSVVTVARLWVPETAPAALRTRFLGPGLAAVSSGVDQAPPGWLCPPTSDTVPGTIVQAGAPDSVFFRFGAMNWASLASWVGSIPPGGDSLVVRYEPGNTILAASRTVGLLVVAGDLTLASGARHAGLVVVGGTLWLDGAGGTVAGAVVASQVIAINGYTSVVPALVYSSCAVLRAAGSRALPVLLEGQGMSGIF